MNRWMLLITFLFSAQLMANISPPNSQNKRLGMSDSFAVDEDVVSYSQQLAKEFPDANISIRSDAYENASSNEVLKELIILEQILTGKLAAPSAPLLEFLACCKPVCGGCDNAIFRTDETGAQEQMAMLAD